MTAGAVAKAGAAAKEKAWENPLIPHARLREMYVGMVEARALAGHLRLHGVRGQEAVRVSTALSLEAGDVTVEARRSGLTALLRGERLGGAKLRAVVEGGFAGEGESAGEGQIAVRAAEARVWAGCGAAAALKLAGGRRVVMVYVGGGEVAGAGWREVLRLAAEGELPVVFVLLPGARGSGLGERERGAGVPCLGVDAGDAVALYRVAQESVGRARAGGGPALLECVRMPGAGVGDAVRVLGESLVQRGLVTEAWRRGVEATVAKRLGLVARG